MTPLNAYIVLLLLHAAAIWPPMESIGIGLKAAMNKFRTKGLHYDSISKKPVSFCNSLSFPDAAFYFLCEIISLFLFDPSSWTTYMVVPVSLKCFPLLTLSPLEQSKHFHFPKHHKKSPISKHDYSRRESSVAQ